MLYIKSHAMFSQQTKEAWTNTLIIIKTSWIKSLKVFNLRYCQVVEHLLAIATQLSHLGLCLFKLTYFTHCVQCTSLEQNCVCVWFAVSWPGRRHGEHGDCEYDDDGDGDNNVDDDSDTDLGGVKADEHGGRPLENSPRTLNQTISPTLHIVIIFILMAVMMMNIVMRMMTVVMTVVMSINA